ncbi:GFA family protein [Litoreibacter halocynthiae]|uniref:GFA family protein n=1 Tax=Litoreibacter halocynthiae TaxID=1242689 RepID=UPI002491757D|nr:GFA family protein [Litoreibacter halocynthiae]
MSRTGSCACGAIRFTITAPFIGVGMCHCTKCQKASGGGPNYVALTPKDGLEVTQGQPSIFQSEGSSGGTIGRAFCGDCGTPLWSIPAHEPFFALKLGALDDNSDLEPEMHIYVSSAPKWHGINDDLPKFPQMPPSG